MNEFLQKNVVSTIKLFMLHILQNLCRRLYAHDMQNKHFCIFNHFILCNLYVNMAQL